MTGRPQAPQPAEEGRKWFASRPGPGPGSAPEPGAAPPAGPGSDISDITLLGRLSNPHPTERPAEPRPAESRAERPAESRPGEQAPGSRPADRPPERRRRPKPPMPGDRLVWPPPPPEDEDEDDEEDRSTQPFAAVRGPSLPLSARPGPGAAEPPAPAPEPPAAAPPVPQTAGLPEPAGAAPRPRRTALLTAGTVVAAALALGLPAWHGYTAYTAGRPDYLVHTVPPGQSRAVQHVAWRAEVEKAEHPSGRPAEPGRQWLRITVFRTPLDEEGVRRSGRPDFALQDREGRSWAVVEIREEPPLPEDQRPGGTYRYELFAEVPVAVADEVELHLRPSRHRDSPTPGASSREAEDAAERQEVLRFMR